MPTIASFFGIRIKMYWEDHLPPHFHVIYQGFEAQITIGESEVIAGALPRTARRIVQDWAGQRRGALMEDWERARNLETLLHIPGPDDDDE